MNQDEESIILPENDNKETKMTIDTGITSKTELPSPAEIINETGIDRGDIFNEIINCVVNSRAVFKSQQKGDPDLTTAEKSTIAGDLFRKNKPMFLSRFGRFMREEHLRYFSDIEKQDYEVMFHMNRLRRYHNYSQRQIDVKNRRYQALKSLVDKGEYFSETEMMRRNPLLYEHLVGQYLTEEQKKARDNIDTQNITFVNLLLESIERDGTRNLKKEQQDAENDVMEENDSDDDDDDDSEDESKSRKYMEKSDIRWGEMSGESSNSTYDKERNEKRAEFFCREISSKERQVLKDEFTTNMYHSFLNGKDKDFDYSRENSFRTSSVILKLHIRTDSVMSTVDDDESYDNVDLRTQDEEEKYFDSESPETIEEYNKMEVEKMGGDESSEEDELDKYMKSLQEEPNANELADEVEKQSIH